MPVRSARIAASLLACIAGASAADLAGDYSWEDLQAGRDIHEGIYNQLSSGEFDEWRLGFTLAPAIDRVQVKGQINDLAYPGPVAVETDRVVNRPAMAPGLDCTWVLGDFDAPDHGWYYGLGFNYQQRAYRILYAIGTESPELRVHQFGVSLEVGYMWYLSRNLRFEFAPRLAGGAMLSQFDTVELDQGFSELRQSLGAWIEGGGRAALAWHPAGTQAWHIGFETNYRSGYGQANFRNDGALGETRTESRLWWYGFGYALYYGRRF